jgi:hypothetical protein
LFNSPSYQRIIQMGSEVVPTILRRLLVSPDHWFWALSCITGENPVPDVAVGDLKLMTEAWIDWGRRHGMLD